MTIQRKDDVPKQYAAKAPPWILADQAVERRRNKIWQMVLHRLREDVDPESAVRDTLAERLGDIGAASGALLTVYGIIGLASKFAPGNVALVQLASDRAARASFSLVGVGA
ncbi:MAG TPA: hypothetical protein PK156_35045 [Polyangium sp.]|nr:hypothetical protein [Polyangium sp.]